MAAPSRKLVVTRFAFAVLATLSLALIIVQAYTAGRGIFVEGAGFGLHAGLGFPVAHMLIPITMIVSFFARGGTSFWVTSLVWGVLAAVFPILAGMGGQAATLHPPLAMVVLLMTGYLSWKGWMLARTPAVDTPATATPAPKPRAPTT